MSPLAMAKIVASFATGGLAVWFAPALLDLVGLGEFAFLGQAALAILALSALEVLFRERFVPPTEPHPAPVSPPSPSPTEA